MKNTDPTSSPPSCPSCGGEIPEAGASCPSCADTEILSSGASGAPAPAVKEIAGFRIIREIGSGGMGTVFEAFDGKMKRRVALKVLSRRLSASEKAGARFAREAWIGGKLGHPNVVKVLERGDWEDLTFFSMELVDGGSLQDVISNMRRFGKDERWSLAFGSREYITWAINQVIAAARGLDHVHRQGIVHRDIKPMNILLNRDPQMVKIADFGLAVGADATRLTTAGKAFGTPIYMPPEQIRGDWDAIDARADVYALGVTLFELLTLELPFVGKTQEIYLQSVLTSEARRPSKINAQVGRDLDIVLRKSLEKNPVDRYASAAEFADDLENVLNFRPVRARPPTPLTRTRKWVRRKPIHAALTAVLILGVPTAVVLSVRAVRQQVALERVEVDRLRTAALQQMHEKEIHQAALTLTEILAHENDDIEALRDRSLCYKEMAVAAEGEGRRAELRDLALADISRIVDMLPDASWPYRVRAHILEEFGRIEEAANDERMAAERKSPTPDLHELEIEGLLALTSGDARRAVDEFTKVLDRRPDFVRGHLWRAQAYESLRDTASAMTDYQFASALRPNDSFPHYNLGRVLTASGELERGESSYRRALEIEPENPYIHEALADNLVRQGKSKATAGDLEGAAASFRRAEEAGRRALALNPNLPTAHLNLGASLSERNRLREAADPALIAEAMTEYEAVLSIWRDAGKDPHEPAYRDALVNQCDGLIQLRQLDRALAACRAIADLEPAAPDNHYNLAGVYALMNRPDDAFAALEKDFQLGDIDHEYLATDDWFASLRDDPRFASLIRRMKEASTQP